MNNSSGNYEKFMEGIPCGELPAYLKPDHWYMKILRKRGRHIPDMLKEIDRLVNVKAERPRGLAPVFQLFSTLAEYCPVLMYYEYDNEFHRLREYAVDLTKKLPDPYLPCLVRNFNFIQADNLPYPYDALEHDPESINIISNPVGLLDACYLFRKFGDLEPLRDLDKAGLARAEVILESYDMVDFTRRWLGFGITRFQKAPPEYQEFLDSVPSV